MYSGFIWNFTHFHISYLDSFRYFSTVSDIYVQFWELNSLGRFRAVLDNRGQSIAVKSKLFKIEEDGVDASFNIEHF